MKTICLLTLLFFSFSAICQLSIINNNKQKNLPPDLVFEKDGKELWNKTLPLRMTYLNNTLNEGEKDTVKYYLETENYLMFPDKTGLLIIEKNSGNYLLNMDEEEVFLFNKTTESKFEITGMDSECTGIPNEGGTIVTECDNKLFYFNGRYVLVLNSNDLSIHKEIIGPKDGFANTTQTPFYSTTIDCKKCKLIVSGKKLL